MVPYISTFTYYMDVCMGYYIPNLHGISRSIYK